MKKSAYPARKELMQIRCDDMDDDNRPSSTLISHNVSVNGHRTSIRLEKEMWMGLKDISMREGCKIHDLCGLVADRKRDATSLTAAIRVFVMAYYQSAATDDGHVRAGHGKGPKSAVESMVKVQSQPYFGLRQQRAYY